MDTNALIALGGAVVVVNGVTQVGIRIICDRLLNGHGKNGFCAEHSKLMSGIEILKTAHTEETRVETLTKALTEALRRNGK